MREIAYGYVVPRIYRVAPKLRGKIKEVFDTIASGPYHARTGTELREIYPDGDPTMRSSIRFLRNRGYILAILFPPGAATQRDRRKTAVASNGAV